MSTRILIVYFDACCACVEPYVVNYSVFPPVQLRGIQMLQLRDSLLAKQVYT